MIMMLMTVYVTRSLTEHDDDDHDQYDVDERVCNQVLKVMRKVVMSVLKYIANQYFDFAQHWDCDLISDSDFNLDFAFAQHWYCEGDKGSLHCH